MYRRHHLAQQRPLVERPRAETDAPRDALRAAQVDVDAVARPFGATFHMDYVAMEPGSKESRAARYYLNVDDEKTDFLMAFPFQTRDAESVVDAMQRFDDAQPEVQ